MWNQNQTNIIYQELKQIISKKTSVFKVEKQEDAYRRRFYLKELKSAKLKEHLSEVKYKEKLLSFNKMRETPNSDISDSEYSDVHIIEVIKPAFTKKKDTSFSYLRDSINSVFHSESKSKLLSFAGNYFEENVLKEDKNLKQNNRKFNEHFLLKKENDNNLNLREFDEKEKFLENTTLMEYKYKCFCEMIYLKGAIWGQLIILKNSLIFFSLNENRPKEDPIFKLILS